MQKRVFIIHGWGGTVDSGWKGWLKRELESRGFSVFSPQMPSAENPKMDEWLFVLRGLVGKPDKNTYLVGHSLGVVCILRHLEGLEEGEKVGGAVLVAGPVEYPDVPQIEGFFRVPFDWARIKGRCEKFASINSDNDHYIPLSHGKLLEERLGAKLVVLQKRGHFSSSEGTKELPEALDALLEMAGEKKG